MHISTIVFLVVSAILLINCSYASQYNASQYKTHAPSWAGYVVVSNTLYPEANTITSVNASWVVANIPASISWEELAQWVGIGAFTEADNTLIQIGTTSETVADVNFYWAFYQIGPTGIPCPILMLVRPGDHIQASVQLVAGTTDQWILSIYDANDLAGFNTFHFPATYNSSEEYGEIIAERPSILGTGTHFILPNFGTAEFGPLYTSLSGTNNAVVEGGQSKSFGLLPNISVSMSLGTSEYPKLAAPTALNGSSFNVIRLLLPLAISTPTPGSLNIMQGQTANIEDSNATGGAPPYYYQWWEIPPGGAESNATNCAAPNTATCRFITTSNTPLGTYAFFLGVTDNVGNNNYSQEVYVNVQSPNSNVSTTQDAQTPFLGYVPVTLTNNQLNATNSVLQVLVPVNSLAYKQYEAGNLQNVEFMYQNGTVIPSWLQANDSNTAKISPYWLKLTKSIPSDSNTLILMGFGSLSKNFLGNVVGMAPTLPANYAQYDSGSNVFPFYDNFAGNVLKSDWVRYNGSNTSITVDNGITFNDSIGGNYVLVISSNGIPSNEFFEVNATYTGNHTVWNSGCDSYYGAGAFDGLLKGEGLSYNGLLYTAYYYWPQFYGGMYVGCQWYAGYMEDYGGLYTNLSDVVIPRQGDFLGGPGGLAWVSNSQELWYKCSTGNGEGRLSCGANAASNWYTDEIVTTQNPNATLFPTIGYLGGIVPNSIATFYWVRTRIMPPNDTLPSVSFGQMRSTQTRALSASTPVQGQAVTFNVVAQSLTDPLNVLFDGTVLLSSTGNALYTFCSGSNVCPSAGVHNVTVNDLTTNQSISQPLIVYNAPVVSVSPNSVSLDSGQTVTFTTNVTGGTGNFVYQWYNGTSGTLNSIANAIHPTFNLTGSATGNFVYNVILTDDGPQTPVNSIANVLVHVYPKLNITISAQSTGLYPSNTVSFTSSTTGGSGNFLYQWLNVTNSVVIPMQNQTFSTYNAPANQLGTFSYVLIVADNVTGYQAASGISNILVNTEPTVTAPVPTNVVLDSGQKEIYSATIYNGIGPFTVNLLLSNGLVVNTITGAAAGIVTFGSFAPGVGTDTYNVVATDKGISPVFVFNSLSNTVTVNNALGTPTLTPNTVSIGVNQIFTLEAALPSGSAGTSPYTYNFLVYNNVGGIVANVLYSALSPASNTASFTLSKAATYTANVTVTDSSTAKIPVNSTDSEITVTNNSFHAPAGIDYYANITIQNVQSSRISNGFQLMLAVNTLSFLCNGKPCVDSPANNIVFFYPNNGTQSNCWQEGDLQNEVLTTGLNAISNDIWWCKIETSVGSDATLANAISIGFNSAYKNQLNGAAVGESPYISSNTALDNGANVFTWYYSFYNTSLGNEAHSPPLGWTAQSSGCTVQYSFHSAGYGSVAATGGNGFCGIYNSIANPPLSMPITADYYGNQYTSGTGQTSSLLYSRTLTSSYYTYGSYGIQNDGNILVDTGGGRFFTNALLADNNHNKVYTLMMLSSTSLTMSLNYTNKYTNTSVTANTANYIYFAPYYCCNSGSSLTMYWVRLRVTPPNGIMPTVTFSTVTQT